MFFVCKLLNSIGDRKLENISSKEHKTFHILPSFFLNVDNSYNIAPRLFKLGVVIFNIKTEGNVSSVFEIKGAPCSLCAHFGCRVHGFKSLCTRRVHVDLYSTLLIPLYRNVHMNR